MKDAGAGGKMTVHDRPALLVISTRVSTFVPIVMPTPSSAGSPGRSVKILARDELPPPPLSLGDPAASAGLAASRAASSSRSPAWGGTRGHDPTTHEQLWGALAGCFEFSKTHDYSDEIPPAWLEAFDG
jgi:hypothetical protein